MAVSGGGRFGGVGGRRDARGSRGATRDRLAAVVQLGPGAWIIGVAALALAGWAVVDLIHADAELPAIRSVPAPAAAEAIGSPGGIVPLHRLLPDATDDLGRRVRLDGVVVGAVLPAGFWVRDLRDNIVFVAVSAPGDGRPAVRRGDMVRVRGVVALLGPGDDAPLREAAGLAVPPAAILIRDIQVRAAAEAIERLESHGP